MNFARILYPYQMFRFNSIHNRQTEENTFFKLNCKKFPLCTFFTEKRENGPVCAGIFSVDLSIIYVKIKITKKDEYCPNHVIYFFKNS